MKIILMSDSHGRNDRVEEVIQLHPDADAYFHCGDIECDPYTFPNVRVVCGNNVEPLNYTARDHCPKCLSSIHVDINPGDRACSCLGILEPTKIEKGKKDTLKIVYKCNLCGEIKKNKAAIDDNYDKILKIMSDSANF